MKGYSINQRFERLEQRVSQTGSKIDFFVVVENSHRFVCFSLIIMDITYFATDFVMTHIFRLTLSAILGKSIIFAIEKAIGVVTMPKQMKK